MYCGVPTAVYQGNTGWVGGCFPDTMGLGGGAGQSSWAILSKMKRF